MPVLLQAAAPGGMGRHMATESFCATPTRFDVSEMQVAHEKAESGVVSDTGETSGRHISAVMILAFFTMASCVLCFKSGFDIARLTDVIDEQYLKKVNFFPQICFAWFEGERHVNELM